MGVNTHRKKKSVKKMAHSQPLDPSYWEKLHILRLFFKPRFFSKVKTSICTSFEIEIISVSASSGAGRGGKNGWQDKGGCGAHLAEPKQTNSPGIPSKQDHSTETSMACATRQRSKDPISRTTRGTQSGLGIHP